MELLRMLLNVNRHNPAAPVDCHAAPSKLLDKDYVEAISRSILGNRKWDVFEATPTIADQLPSQGGLYMFVWRKFFPMPGRNIQGDRLRVVLYVGKAGGSTDGTIRSRYVGEYAKIVGQHPESIWQAPENGRKAKLRRLLNLRDLEFWCCGIMQHDIIEQLEASLIEILTPPGNTVVGVRATLGRAIPAFGPT